MAAALALVRPGPEHLQGYVDALKRGWAFNLSGPGELLRQIEESPEAFLRACNDALALPVHRITRWIWDGEFCGEMHFRWQEGTTGLPPTCLGHIGYSVVPWKQKRGYATAALARLLPEAAKRGLRFVEIVTNLENTASQKVVLNNGGVLVERFEKLPANGGGTALRFRISL
ncbi:MAG TPA: GNAT family N-acetyltransferase [Candidatus Baltobacteraceae bacterium]